MKTLLGFPQEHRFGIAVGFLFSLLLCGSFIVIEVKNAEKKHRETSLGGLASVRGGFLTTKSVQSDSYSIAAANEKATNDRKLVIRATLSLRVNDLKNVTSTVRTILAKRGGYISQETASADSKLHGSWMELRVPSTEFDATLAEVEQLAVSIESKETKVNDVTRDYVDHETKIRVLQSETEQYTRLLGTSTSVKDILAVRERLDEVVHELETEKGELRFLSQEADFATISLNWRLASAPSGPTWNLRNIVKQAYENGASALVNWAAVAIGVLFFLPALLLWGVSLLLVSVSIFLIYRKISSLIPLAERTSVNPLPE